MPRVLCFDCGSTFDIGYGVEKPTQQCPNCKDAEDK
jgi:predicted Zn-ribbon and HTH transcriptional regulator